ncbi:MAG: hypothetical protein RLZZ436_3284, partial [Planctomycetota bacterium]
RCVGRGLYPRASALRLIAFVLRVCRVTQRAGGSPRLRFRTLVRGLACGVSGALAGVFTRGLPPCGSGVAGALGCDLRIGACAWLRCQRCVGRALYPRASALRLRCCGSPRLRFAHWCVCVAAALALRWQGTLPAGFRPAAQCCCRPAAQCCFRPAAQCCCRSAARRVLSGWFRRSGSWLVWRAEFSGVCCVSDQNPASDRGFPSARAMRLRRSLESIFFDSGRTLPSARRKLT